MDHKDLDVWIKGVDLVELIYKVSSSFPDDERLGFTSENKEVMDLITDEKKLLLGYRNHIRKKVQS